MTYSFAEPGDLERLRMPAEGLGEPVELINPLNADQSVMRQSIIPGLLRSVAYNQSRGVKNVQLYETGVVFYAHEGKKQPKEKRKVAGVLAGAMREAGWNDAPAAFDFFDGKGVVESLARELALPKLRFKALSADEAPHLQPGRAAAVLSGGTELGWVGELHPLAVDAYQAEAPVVAFELDVDALVKAARPARDYRGRAHLPCGVHGRGVRGGRGCDLREAHAVHERRPAGSCSRTRACSTCTATRSALAPARNRWPSR